MLFDTPALDGLEEAVVGRIDEVRKTLSYATAAKRWTGVLARMTVRPRASRNPTASKATT